MTGRGEGLLSGLPAEAPAPSQSASVSSRPFEEELLISGEPTGGTGLSRPDPMISIPDSQLLVTLSGFATSTPYLEASSEDSALPSDTSLSIIGVEFSVPADCGVLFAGTALQEVNGNAWENVDQTCTQVLDDGPPPACVETAYVQSVECPERAVPAEHSAPEPVTDQSAAQSPGHDPLPNDVGIDEESLTSCTEADAAAEEVAPAAVEIGQLAAQTRDDKPLPNIANTEDEPVQPDIEASRVYEADKETSPAGQLPALDPGEITSPVEQAEAAKLVMQSVGTDVEKSPSRYRPPAQRTTRPVPRRPANQEPGRACPSEVSLEIRVRLTFDRFGLCDIGLLPERTADLDDEVAVTLGGESLCLLAQEDWYQDLQFEKIGDYLRRGLELRGLLADNRRARWLLTGRNIYVLASHQRASGFVSTTRLVLGRSHVVLCAAEVLQQVEAALNEAGCQGYTKLDEARGIPSGWTGLRAVTPSRAVPLEAGIDPFYAIKPAPDIEIELEGGVCLRNSIWLAGFPPRIKLLGDVSAPVKVLIDDKEAGPSGDGSLAVDGYDQPGQHFVYCVGLSCSRSYSIENPPDLWAEWPAYHFGQAEICGPLVHLLPQATRRRIFSVPMSNPLLLGAEPGQIFRCSPRSVKSWKGFVPFDVVWALPAQPYICDKKTARIIQFAQAPLALPPSPKQPVFAWCAAILEASRKGLQIENASSDRTVLWKAYKKAARDIWRAAR
jgi:hypothetical protein